MGQLPAVMFFLPSHVHIQLVTDHQLKDPRSIVPLATFWRIKGVTDLVNLGVIFMQGIDIARTVRISSM